MKPSLFNSFEVSKISLFHQPPPEFDEGEDRRILRIEVKIYLMLTPFSINCTLTFNIKICKTQFNVFIMFS